MSLLRLASSAIALALLAACSGNKPVEAPPRAADAIPETSEASVIAVPVDMDSAILSRALDREIPRRLWSIDQHESRCIQPQHVRLFGRDVPVTPPISCTIVGTVTRGAMRLRGEGREIVVDLPIHARISARDVGGVFKGETATGSARVQARIRLALNPDWTPHGTVLLHYDWTTPPGIDFLGQRITFTDKADEHLQPIMRRLEQSLPRELEKLRLRQRVAQLWRDSFRTILLNERNPSVWMRLTPRQLIYDGYRLENGRLRLDLGLEAVTETFVGITPPAPEPTPLPPLGRTDTPEQLRFFIPVVADYGQLEPVIQRALARRALRPFELPGIGPVNARFEKVVAYGTTGGRIAVGLTIAARPAGADLGETHGLVWVTARPVNAPGSATVAFQDLAIAGDTDGVGGDLVLSLARSPGVSAVIAASLTQNFSHDLEELLGKIRRAIEEKREGDFTIRAHITQVQTGRISAHGPGLYLPVRVTGQAHIDYRPGQGGR